MAIPVLLILAVLWAVVLIPPVLRSRNASQGSSIGDYTQRLGVLGNHSVSRLGRTAPRPRRHLHVVPAVRNGSTRHRVTAGRAPMSGARPRPAGARPASVSTEAQRRRREVLLVLAGAAAATLLLFLVVRSPLVLGLQLIADVLLVGYIGLLIRYTQHHPARTSIYAGAPRHRPRPVAAIRHPEPPPRPELAPVPELALYRTASR